MSTPYPHAYRQTAAAQMSDPLPAKSPSRWIAVVALVVAVVGLLPLSVAHAFGWVRYLEGEYRWFPWQSVWPGHYRFDMDDTYTPWLIARMIAFFCAATLLIIARGPGMKRVAAITLGAAVAVAFLLGFLGYPNVPMLIGLPVTLLGALGGIALILVGTGRFRARTRAAWRAVTYVCSGAVVALVLLSTRMVYMTGPDAYGTWWEILSRRGINGLWESLAETYPIDYQWPAILAMVPATMVITALVLVTALVGRADKVDRAAEKKSACVAMQLPVGSRGVWVAVILLVAASASILPLWLTTDMEVFQSSDNLPFGWSLTLLWPGQWTYSYDDPSLAPWLIMRIVLFLLAALVLVLAKKNAAWLRTGVVLSGISVAAAFLMGLVGNVFVARSIGLVIVALGVLSGIALIIVANGYRRATTQTIWRIVVYATSGAALIGVAITTQWNYLGNGLASWWSDIYGRSQAGSDSGSLPTPMSCIAAMIPITLVVAALCTLTASLSHKPTTRYHDAPQLPAAQPYPVGSSSPYAPAPQAVSAQPYPSAQYSPAHQGDHLPKQPASPAQSSPVSQPYSPVPQQYSSVPHEYSPTPQAQPMPPHQVPTPEPAQYSQVRQQYPQVPPTPYPQAPISPYAPPPTSPYPEGPWDLDMTHPHPTTQYPLAPQLPPAPPWTDPAQYPQAPQSPPPPWAQTPQAPSWPPQQY